MIVHGVFKKIQVDFKLIGYMHEDIDAYFSHLSKALKRKNTFVLADLMKIFMQSQELSFILEFIQEVVDFKSFICGYQNSGPIRLIGLEEMYFFKFYVDSDGWPIMKYKKSAITADWLSLNRPPFDYGLQTGMAGQNFLRGHQSWFHSSLSGEMRSQNLLEISEGKRDGIQSY